MSVERYSAAFLGCSRLQLEEIDIRTRNLLILHNGFEPKSNIDQLYLSQSEASKGLIRVKGTVETAILGLGDYVRNIKERLLIATCTVEEDKYRETPNEYKKRKKNEIKTQWTQKEFIKQTTGEVNKYR